MAVTQEEWQQMVTKVKEQIDIIKNLEVRLQQVEMDKKKNRHGHIHFGKELCPEAFDGKSSEGFKSWKVKAVNYLSNDDSNNVNDHNCNHINNGDNTNNGGNSNNNNDDKS